MRTPLDISEIRRENLRTLIRDRANGSVGALARIAGFDSPTILSQVSGKTPSRNIGPNLARRIEKALKLSKGWLDTDHSAPADLSGLSNEKAERARRVVQLLDQLPDGARVAAEQLIDELAGSLSRKKGR